MTIIGILYFKVNNKKKNYVKAVNLLSIDILYL